MVVEKSEFFFLILSANTAIVFFPRMPVIAEARFIQDHAVAQPML